MRSSLRLTIIILKNTFIKSSMLVLFMKNCLNSGFSISGSIFKNKAGSDSGFKIGKLRMEKDYKQILTKLIKIYIKYQIQPFNHVIVFAPQIRPFQECVANSAFF